MGRGLKVLKFGGSSLSTAGDVRRVVSIISDAVPEDNGIIVVSALKGVTNELVALADRLGEPGQAGYLKTIRDRHLRIASGLLSSSLFESYRETVDGLCAQLWRRVVIGSPGDPASRDEILAIGERLSAPLLATCIAQYRRAATSHDAANFIRTDSSFGAARINWKTTRKLVADWYATSSGIRVVTGFVGSDRHGRTTTLGRGGSDYSAAVLASVLKADVFERWTDVDGIYTNDPDIDPLAERLETIRLKTARDWNRAGRMGMHRRALDPLAKVSVPVHVRSTFDPKKEGTWILP
jgi:aspartate kinase